MLVSFYPLNDLMNRKRCSNSLLISHSPVNDGILGRSIMQSVQSDATSGRQWEGLGLWLAQSRKGMEWRRMVLR